MTNEGKMITTSAYLEFLKEVKKKIASARISAYRKLNKGLISLYWDIGKIIFERQQQFGWGKSVVEKLAKDLQRDYPASKGFSARNLWDMRRFYIEYKDLENLRQLVAEIPWGQNLVIGFCFISSQSIGIILCKSRDRLEVEYALRGIRKPIGVSEYRLTKKLPKDLTKSLPTPEMLRKGLEHSK